MKTAYKIFLIVIITAFVNQTFSQKLITMDDAVKIALTQNSGIVKSTNSIASFESGVKSAYGNLLPNLSINGGFNWQRVSDNGGKTQIDYFGNPQTLGPSQIDSRNWSVSGGGSVTLFNGLSNIATINQSKANLESAKLSLEKLKQDVVLQTITYYTQIISYQKLLKFQQENLNYNKGLLEQIKEKYNLKMVPISDVYSQEAQTANSRVSYLQAKNNFETSKINLLSYLSLDVAQSYQFDSVATVTSDTSIVGSDIQSLYDYALNNRKDYLSMKYQLESANSQLTIARGGMFPTLSANYGLSSSAVQPSDLFNRRVYSLGLSLNVPIFSNWRTENAIQTAEVQLKNNNEDLKTLELNIKSQVITNDLNLKTAKEQLDASNSALTASKESWMIATEKYKLGAATYLDLQLAYNNYLQAQYNKINNDYNYLIAQYGLLNTLGKY